MLKFFRKYELSIRIIATTAWFVAAGYRLFLNEGSINKNFDLFVGIIMVIVGIYFLVEVIQLIRQKKRNRIAESKSE